jgi:hypothetical protein
MSRHRGTGHLAQNARSTTMLILNRDGTPLWNRSGGQNDARIKTTIDVPAALALHDSTMIERPIRAVFDQLRHSVVELCLRSVK